MFFEQMPVVQREEYLNYLKLMGSLSRLFTDSDTPYLPYRIAENMFCWAFEADNLSRADVSADAKKSGIGLGLKTFLQGNNKTWQKIAEFNRDFATYEHLELDEKIRQVAILRNERLSFTHRTYNIERLYYHCVLRDKQTMAIFEEPMLMIDLDSLSSAKWQKTSIIFNDKHYAYKFYPAKSTLYKQFKTEHLIQQIDAPILENPLEQLLACFQQIDYSESAIESIVLPLYSARSGQVHERSGLNQWNASGRKRHPSEVYIPIPIWIHHVFPDFFPPRDTPFDLRLPNDALLNVKVSQDNSKALMSNPNKALGNWILRDVLHLDDYELLTMDMLDTIGIDSVRISKDTRTNTFQIDFCASGTYETFEQNYRV